MKTRWRVLVAVTASALIACGPADDGGGDAVDAKSVKTGDVKQPDAPGPASKEVEHQSASDTRKITGDGAVAADAGAGVAVTVELTIGKGAVVGGHIALGDDKHALRGILDDDTLRCWIVNGVDNPDSTWRGTLVGTAQGDAFSGTFNLSDDGAAKVISGTWKSRS